MKHTITITVAPGTAGGWLKFDKITKEGIDYMITKNYEVVNKLMAKPSDEALMLRITNENNFSFNFDDDANNKDNRNYHRKRMGEIIPYHHQVLTEGFKNPNSGAAMLFQLEDAAMNHQRNFNVIAMIRLALNKVWDMSFREKMNVMYFYGENPAGMGHKELTIRLSEPNFGIILRRTPFGTTGLTFIEHFVKEYKDADETQVLKTSILKGLLLTDYEGKLIMKKEGAAYIFGTSIIGSNIDEACVWLNNNPEKKKYLYDCLKVSDKIDFDDIDIAIAQFENGNEDGISVPNTMSEEDARATGKRLGVRTWHKILMPRLLEEIKAAEAIWEEAKVLGLLPTINTATKKMFVDEIEALVTKTKKELDKNEKKPKGLTEEEKKKLVEAV